MKTYKITLKHDSGTIKVTTKAKDLKTAIEMVCTAEDCPRTAVVKTKEIFTLIELTAKRSVVRERGRRFNVTDIYLPDGSFMCRFGMGAKQPRRGRKTIIINCFKWALKWE